MPSWYCGLIGLVQVLQQLVTVSTTTPLQLATWEGFIEHT